ncbi:unnamed protein product [Lactuca virosa]|uniref:EF-hand domain-containing protein n=1 Tax=Lactuca virosa TaxID=75947 RepID=A0AAU9MKF4_9ASTR|nr:unnamed protein product [Lactuca virosa]
MEEVSRMAKAYYHASPVDLQKLFIGFFCAMDDDGNGKIDKKEFLEFMNDEGGGKSTKFSIFNLLDVDKNGTLDFYEMMTAFYIIMSERPFCDSCEKFITSSYFTCVGCLENQIESSFDLCLDCYYMKKCVHTHNGSDRFLDNHSLLAITKSIIKEASSSTAMKTTSVVKDAGGRCVDDPQQQKRVSEL